MGISSRMNEGQWLLSTNLFWYKPCAAEDRRHIFVNTRTPHCVDYFLCCNFRYR